MTSESDVTLGATTSWVLLATGAAICLIVYAVLTLINLLPSSSAQDLVRLV